MTKCIYYSKLLELTTEIFKFWKIYFLNFGNLETSVLFVFIIYKNIR